MYKYFCLIWAPLNCGMTKNTYIIDSDFSYL